MFVNMFTSTTSGTSTEFENMSVQYSNVFKTEDVMDKQCSPRPYCWCGSGLILFALTWPRGYKTFFMLNSIEHEIFSAHKC